MSEAGDGHLQSQDEVNEDKHINFLARQKSDKDAAFNKQTGSESENINDKETVESDEELEIENGFFTVDDENAQNKQLVDKNKKNDDDEKDII